MIEKLLPNKHQAEETIRRTVVKTITYRTLIIILDFLLIYVFTNKINVALWYTIVSNIYTSFGYYFHERIWDKIKWGKRIYKKVDE